ncbi:MAG: hypothetical protein IJL92_04545 [Thermoguttaceae bacterium]|nr:hypothetical protein [Thermoguttaceae bacterium]
MEIMGVFEAAAGATMMLYQGLDELQEKYHKSLSEIPESAIPQNKLEAMFNCVSEIEEAAHRFQRIAKSVVVAEDATTTSEEISNG